MRDRSTILWRRVDLPGHELAELSPTDIGWTLTGVALLAHRGLPHRLEYTIECDRQWRTTRVHLHGQSIDANRQLELTCSAQGAWCVDGAPQPAVAGCIDVDLGFSPSTNLLPIRRLNLPVGGSATVRAAWVRFPELSLEPLEQIYTRVDASSYQYESAGGAFTRLLTVAPDGFVLQYPDFWQAETHVPATENRDSRSVEART